jgi:hypothetical protein
LREGHKLQVSEFRALRKIFGTDKGRMDRLQYYITRSFVDYRRSTGWYRQNNEAWRDSAYTIAVKKALAIRPN